MKLILTQEVDGLGAPGDVVEVKDGYGRNYLIPRGLGLRWTRGGEKTIESIKAARASRAARDSDHAVEIKNKLEQGPVNVKVRSGEGGRLFGAVTTAEIADAITETSGEKVDRRTIVVTNADQVARRPRGVGQAARRGVRQGHPQRRSGLTHYTFARPVCSSERAGRSSFPAQPWKTFVRATIASRNTGLLRVSTSMMTLPVRAPW